VESTIKQLNAHVKGSEKYWLEGVAEALLQLRSAHHSEGGAAQRYWDKPRPYQRAVGAKRLRAFVLAPDGRRAAYERVWVDADTRQERHARWLVDGQPDRARPLERGQPDARGPVFSPDGQRIAFLSARQRPAGWRQTPPVPPASDPAVDVWLIPATVGPAVPLAGPDKPYGRAFHDGFYGRVAFAPDGRRLLFVADDGRDPRSPEERDADVEVVRPDQGEGYTGYRPAQLWLADLDPAPGPAAARRVRRLTDDDAWYGDPQWAPDGRAVVGHANRGPDREAVSSSINKDYDLWAVDVDTGALRRLTSGPGPEVSPRFAPDGRRLACLSIPRWGSHLDVFNLAIVTLGAAGPRTEVLFDHHGPGAARPPHPPPSFPLPEDCWDGNGHLLYDAAVGTGTATVRVALDTGRGARLELPPPEKDEAAGGEGLPGRLRQRRRLTPPGDRFLRERTLAESRVVTWQAADGRPLEGVLTVPPASVARPPYKLLVYPHGGPHGRSTTDFNVTAQVFAAQGYAVLQPNFRGSAGYGQAFLDADRGDLGGEARSGGDRGVAGAGGVPGGARQHPGTAAVAAARLLAGRASVPLARRASGVRGRPASGRAGVAVVCVEGSAAPAPSAGVRRPWPWRAQGR
jgi:dipeptidyl aminopeptidase/acylaminoacyl peptidase